jgi:hypothetical protein
MLKIKTLNIFNVKKSESTILQVKQMDSNLRAQRYDFFNVLPNILLYSCSILTPYPL